MLFKKLPGELIQAETDGPGGMEWLTGKKGEPMDIISVYETMSEIRKFDLDDLKMLMKENAAKIFIS
jgi:Tat protein secretion system quality control protein TatD with DNase activity